MNRTAGHQWRWVEGRIGIQQRKIGGHAGENLHDVSNAGNLAISKGTVPLRQGNREIVNRVTMEIPPMAR
jgi:hypothetical protein